MEESINQRKNDINNIEKIMTDINSLAKDLAVETQKQGDSLSRLDENITHVQVNTKVALEELTEAQVHQKKSGKCLYIILGLIILAVAVVVVIVVLKTTGGSSSSSNDSSSTNKTSTFKMPTSEEYSLEDVINLFLS